MSKPTTTQQGTTAKPLSASEKADTHFLTNIDFSQIDEMDPNLFNGHKVIFDSDIELEVRLIDDNN